MKLQKKMKKSDLYATLLFIILFAVYQYGIHQIYGMSEYPDEFGYWSTAANMLGWDWSHVASRGSYYSFGYSLILFPVLKFCEDSVTAYRMAVTVNFSLIFVSFFLLKGIYKRIFTEQVEGEEILAIGMALLYPAWNFYAQTTLADSLLIFMVILIGYLFLRFIEVPSFKWGILLIAAVMYNYSLHMRSAGILVAVVIAVIIRAWKTPSYRKGVFLLLLGIVGLFLMIGWMKGEVQGNVFSEAGQELLNSNDYGGQWSKIVFLFSLEGLKQLFTVTMGKVLYLGIASAGLVFAAFVWCGEQVAGLWKKRGVNVEQCGVNGQLYGVKVYKYGEKREYCGINRDASGVKGTPCGIKEGRSGREANWFGLLLLLMILGQLGVCVIYTIHTNNTDWLIYGRYVEAIIPIGIFTGASYTLQKIETFAHDDSILKRGILITFFRKKKIQIGMVFIYTVAAVSCICKVWGQTSDHIRGEHSVAAIFLSGDGMVEPVKFFFMVWIAGLIYMVLVKTVLKRFKAERNSILVMTVLFAILAAWSIYASENYTYKGNDHMGRERIIAHVLQEQLAEGKEIYYLEEGNGTWICFTQMQLRDKTLPVIQIEDLEKLDSENCAVVVDGESECLEYMEDNYNRKIAGSYHYVFYED